MTDKPDVPNARPIPPPSRLPEPQEPDQYDPGSLMFVGIAIAVFTVPAAYLVGWLAEQESGWDEDSWFWFGLLSGLAIGLTLFLRGLGRRLGWWM